MSSLQQIIDWKGQSKNSIVPSFSRPLLGTEKYNTGPDFKPRPIKHWRKQLSPINDAGRGRAKLGMPMDTPGGSVYLGTTNCINCNGPNSDSFSAGIKEYIDHGSIIPPTPQDIYINPLTQQVKCVACNPENNIIKPGIVLLNDNYYTDSNAYLKARCRQYDQRLSTNPKPYVEYINPNTGNPVPPSNSPNGSQVRLMKECDDKCTETKQAITIYKPNNQQFAKQGAVSSGTRLNRLKYNTITKNGNSFNTVWGQEGANAGRYQGTQESTYFIKSKIQPPVCMRRNGDKNLCPFPG